MKKLLILLLFTSKLYAQTTITQSHVINLIPDLAAKLAKTDSGATYQTKYRSDTGRSNAYIAIAAKGVGTVTSIATSNGITGGTITGTGTISGVNAAADGSTKGVASFTASDFDATTGNISIDYTNGQAAATGAKGFLTSTDWNTFNNKGTVTSVSVTTANGVSGSVASSTTTPAITLALGAITPTTVNGNTITAGSSTYTGTAAMTYTMPDTTGTIALLPRSSTVTGTDDTTTLTTIQNATGLSVWGRANKKYRVTAVLYIGCDNTGGVAVGVGGPAGSATVGGQWVGISTSATSVHTQRMTSIGNVVGTAYNRFVNTTGSVQLTGYITTSATAGAITIVFKSATLGNKSTIYTGSTMDLTEIN